MTDPQRGVVDLLTADHREFDALVTQNMAPTRSHPKTPNDSAVRTVAGPVASLLDQLSDAVSGRGRTGD